MPLNLWIAMRDSECRNVLASGSLDRDKLSLPAWCRYLPLKASMTGAINTFKDSILIDNNDMGVDGVMHCKCLEIVLADTEIVDFFAAGKLTRDTKHDGYRLYDTPIVLMSVMYYGVIDVRLG